MNVYHYNNSWQKEAVIAGMKIILKLAVEVKEIKEHVSYEGKDDKTKDSLRK